MSKFPEIHGGSLTDLKRKGPVAESRNLGKPTNCFLRQVTEEPSHHFFQKRERGSPQGKGVIWESETQ